jgi:hypothetical protein
LLGTIIFNKLEDSADFLKDQFSWEHPIGRAEATLSLTALAIKPIFIPAGATHYHVLNHVSIISDYIYDEANRRYEPLSQLNTKSAFIYSEYTLVGASLTDNLVAAFPTGTTLTDDDTIIQVTACGLPQDAKGYRRGEDDYTAHQERV